MMDSRKWGKRMKRISNRKSAGARPVASLLSDSIKKGILHKATPEVVILAPFHFSTLLAT
jgi:hypothetical protein